MTSGEVNQGIIREIKQTITQEGLDNSSAKIFEINTVCIAMYGATAGKVGLLKVQSSTNQAVCGIKPNKEYLPEFLYYFLCSKEKEMISLSVGGAQPNISQTIIKSLKIPKISIEEQKNITQKSEEERVVIEGNKKLIEIFSQKIQNRINKVWGED
jgi:restriction endonuclease S subunit